MTNEELEKVQKNVCDGLDRLNLIDTRIAEFQAQLQKLRDMRRQAVLFTARNLKPMNQENRDLILQDTSPELAEEITRNILSFTDLAVFDRRELQKLLFKCDNADLALALVLMDNTDVKKQIYSNVSKNNLQEIRETEKSFGDPASINKVDVAKAQRKILDLCLDMEKRGEIMFPEGI